MELYGALPLPRPQILHSNISCTKDVSEYFHKLHHLREFRYVTWKIRVGTKERIVALAKTGHRDADFIDFVEDLPKTEARFAVFDFSCKTPEWGHKDALLFIYWCPFEGSSNESRIIYASTKALVLSVLRKNTSLKAVEVTDMEDLTEQNLMSKLMPYRDRHVNLPIFRKAV